MRVCIAPGSVNAHLTAPPSKSMMQRACAAALLHRGETIISNPGVSDDDTAALAIIQQLGATVVGQEDGTIKITSNGVHPISDHIDCGESGLASRLFIPIAAISDKKLRIDGSGSLLKRLMYPVDSVLHLLEVRMWDYAGHLPFSIQGPLQLQDIHLDGSQGSQLLSGVLMALAFTTPKPVTIYVNNLQSIPYIDMTLQLLKGYGIKIEHNNYTIFYIPAFAASNERSIKLNIEGDWSSAAPWLVAGAIGGSITLHGLALDTAQADRQIIDVLQRVGAKVSVENDAITVSKDTLQPFSFDARHCPDLFPTLSVLAACCEGDSDIAGVGRLLNKESNRAESIAAMLHVLGVPYSIADDTLHIKGIRSLNGGTIDSHNDHRIVMTAVIASLRAKEDICITNAEAIRKSYPAFFVDAIKAGLSLRTNHEA